MDDTAVTWANYESHRSTITYQTRLEILALLNDLRNTSSDEGRSREFLHGIDIATQVVRHNVRG